MSGTGVRGAGAPAGGEGARPEPGRRGDAGPASGSWFRQADSALGAFRAGRYHEALDRYRAAFQEAEREGGPAAAKGRLLRGAGVCRSALSDYRGALEDFSRARAYTIAGGDREDLAALDADIASTYLYQDDPQNARPIYQRALGWLADSPGSPHRAAILANLGVVDLREKRYARAIESLGLALRAAEASGDRRVEASAYELLGIARLRLGDYARARELFECSLAVRRSLAEGADVTRLITWLGWTEMESGNPTAAIEKLDQSVASAGQRESRIDLWKGLYLRGRARRALGEWGPATQDLGRAVQVLESIRGNVAPRDALRVTYEVSHHEVYDALAGLLCEQGRVAEAFHAVELGRAQSLRTLIESRPGEGAETQRRELEARFAPALELREAQAQVLDGQSLLLDYYAGAKGTYLWAITDSEARFYRLPPAAEWREEIRRFLAALQTPGGDSAGMGRRLYRTLLGAVDPRLLERRRWIITADDDLVLLPFCALPGPERSGRHYLIEGRSLDYAPSVSVLYSLREAPPRRYEYDFLGVADPVVNRADPRWREAPAAIDAAERLPRLASSAAEIESCARLFGRSTLLTGFAASESELRRRAAHAYRYWHFTSHVVADAEQPERSFLALSIPKRGSRIEKLTAPDVLGLPARAEMVLLSGCDSGAGKNLPGSGVMGLTRAFLAAGARSVCATRWKIPDEGGALVTRFYARLASDGARPDFADRAEALRDAQVEMIRAGGWRSQPQYWAAYFLVGAARSPAADRSRKTENAQRR